MTPTKQVIALFLSFLVLLTGVACVMLWRGDLVIPGKTNALYSLETARTAERVREILALWQDRRHEACRLNTVDFLVPIGYTSAFLFIFLRFASIHPSTFFKRNLRWLWSAAVIAGLCDIFEGVITYRWLNGNVDELSPKIVYATSLAKFCLAALLTIFVVIGVLGIVTKKRQLRSKQPL
jgi:hypothetical protein